MRFQCTYQSSILVGTALARKTSLRISSWIPSMKLKYSARAGFLLIPDCPTRFLKLAIYLASFPFFWCKFFSAALVYPPSSIGVNAFINVFLNSSYVPKSLAAILVASQFSFHALAVPPVMSDNTNMIFLLL